MRKNLGNAIVKKAIIWAMTLMMAFAPAVSGIGTMTVYAEEAENSEGEDGNGGSDSEGGSESSSESSSETSTESSDDSTPNDGKAESKSDTDNESRTSVETNTKEGETVKESENSDVLDHTEVITTAEVETHYVIAHEGEDGSYVNVEGTDAEGKVDYIEVSSKDVKVEKQHVYQITDENGETKYETLKEGEKYRFGFLNADGTFEDVPESDPREGCACYVVTTGELGTQYSEVTTQYWVNDTEKGRIQVDKDVYDILSKIESSEKIGIEFEGNYEVPEGYSVEKIFTIKGKDNKEIELKKEAGLTDADFIEDEESGKTYIKAEAEYKVTLNAEVRNKNREITVDSGETIKTTQVIGVKLDGEVYPCNVQNDRPGVKTITLTRDGETTVVTRTETEIVTGKGKKQKLVTVTVKQNGDETTYYSDEAAKEDIGFNPNDVVQNTYTFITINGTKYELEGDKITIDDVKYKIPGEGVTPSATYTVKGNAVSESKIAYAISYEVYKTDENNRQVKLCEIDAAVKQNIEQKNYTRLADKYVVKDISGRDVFFDTDDFKVIIDNKVTYTEKTTAYYVDADSVKVSSSGDLQVTRTVDGAAVPTTVRVNFTEHNNGVVRILADETGKPMITAAVDPEDASKVIVAIAYEKKVITGFEKDADGNYLLDANNERIPVYGWISSEGELPLLYTYTLDSFGPDNIATLDVSCEATELTYEEKVIFTTKTTTVPGTEETLENGAVVGDKSGALNEAKDTKDFNHIHVTILPYDNNVTRDHKYAGRIRNAKVSILVDGEFKQAGKTVSTASTDRSEFWYEDKEGLDNFEIKLAENKDLGSALGLTTEAKKPGQKAVINGHNLLKFEFDVEIEPGKVITVVQYVYPEEMNFDKNTKTFLTYNSCGGGFDLVVDEGKFFEYLKEKTPDITTVTNTYDIKGDGLTGAAGFRTVSGIVILPQTPEEPGTPGGGGGGTPDPVAVATAYNIEDEDTPLAAGLPQEYILEDEPTPLSDSVPTTGDATIPVAPFAAAGIGAALAALCVSLRRKKDI